jgi:hypothetical protein
MRKIWGSQMKRSFNVYVQPHEARRMALVKAMVRNSLVNMFGYRHGLVPGCIGGMHFKGLIRVIIGAIVVVLGENWEPARTETLKMFDNWPASLFQQAPHEATKLHPMINKVSPF